jgi:hypothetical protein
MRDCKFSRLASIVLPAVILKQQGDKMAKKKRSTGAGAATRKALSGIDKAQKALQLHLKNLRKAMGHPHTPSRLKGHPHTAR